MVPDHSSGPSRGSREHVPFVRLPAAAVTATVNASALGTAPTPHWTADPVQREFLGNGNDARPARGDPRLDDRGGPIVDDAEPGRPATGAPTLRRPTHHDNVGVVASTETPRGPDGREIRTISGERPPATGAHVRILARTSARAPTTAAGADDQGRHESPRPPNRTAAYDTASHDDPREDHRG
ncbi:hypothetical protein GCM10010429_00420 [Micromonospora olivasterospora]